MERNKTAQNKRWQESMREYDIDLTDVESAEELHALLRERLPLPGYYGSNLDALYDVLTERADGWSLVLSGIDTAEAVLGSYFGRFRRMLEHAAQDNPRFTVSFADDGDAMDPKLVF